MTHPTHAACRGRCRVAPRWRAHHDRLLRVESDPDAMLDLFETAVTWTELQHPPEVIPPERWMDFAARHGWRDPGHVERVFSLASDIARVARRTAPAGVSAAGR